MNLSYKLGQILGVDPLDSIEVLQDGIFLFEQLKHTLHLIIMSFNSELQIDKYIRKDDWIISQYALLAPNQYIS